MCYNGAPVLSKYGIYFSKAVRSYGNILLWGIVLVSLVLSPFIMIVWHLREDTLRERIHPSKILYTHIPYAYPYKKTQRCTHASRRSVSASEHKDTEARRGPSSNKEMLTYGVILLHKANVSVQLHTCTEKSNDTHQQWVNFKICTHLHTQA